ncbi:hypothetical protein [Aureitalea marina]|uniref:PsbP C-terminal domain-containing protein n=1 Tax=Aureitalea marina TaxID=930804 RepID=A0A2S7KTC1_9FLAO|nr:hypothetical protein [Aureitalea marina]PQB05783.1 hypothetical protein BST85_13425 [Aureitalea marina]
MKEKITILLLVLFPFILFGQNDELVEYSNELYKYQVAIPSDWSVYYENKNDTIRKLSIISWGLPKIQDTILNQEVENSISIKAYNRPSISSLSDLQLNERLRVDPVKTAMVWDEDGGGFQRIYHSDNGIEYYGKTFYEFKNGIGYIITFMATEGTYDKNVSKFDSFYEQFRVIKK